MMLHTSLASAVLRRSADLPSLFAETGTRSLPSEAEYGVLRL